MQKSLANSLLAAALICTGCETSSHYHSAAYCQPNNCQPACNSCPAPACSSHVQCWDYIPTDDDAEDFGERWARRSLHQLQRCSHERLSSDFRDGFEQAYVDLAKGGNGVVPAVPPKKYWKARYRAPQGRIQAYQWVGGYEAGATTGRSEGITEFRAVPSSFDYEYCGGYVGCHSGCQTLTCESSAGSFAEQQLTPIPQPALEDEVPTEAAPPPAPAPTDTPPLAPVPAPAAEPDEPTEAGGSDAWNIRSLPPGPFSDFGHVDAGAIGLDDFAFPPFEGAGHTDFSQP